mmetsp:Transcript_112365/g.323027  ORF Transcript_112365/g.323027 Transcript_112365/m.323027 type:complete len:287 (+) Transcript_112365:162-1022(+)
MFGPLLRAMFSFDLVAGVVIGLLAGICIGVYCVRAAAGEQYTSLPTSLPAPDAAVKDEKKRRTPAELIGRPTATGSATQAEMMPGSGKVGTGASASARTAIEAPPIRTTPSKTALGYCSDEDDAWLDAESGTEDATPYRAVGRSRGVGTTVVTAEIQSVADSCDSQLDMKRSFPKNDPALKHYAKSGYVGTFTGMFGDKKTMYCHHVTAGGELAVRAAGDRIFTSEDEVWAFLGKCCSGRFAYDRKNRALSCGKLVRGDHDNTCNDETCLFVKNGLKCPTPVWAHK